MLRTSVTGLDSATTNLANVNVSHGLNLLGYDDPGFWVWERVIFYFFATYVVVYILPILSIPEYYILITVWVSRLVLVKHNDVAWFKA